MMAFRSAVSTLVFTKAAAVWTVSPVMAQGGQPPPPPVPLVGFADGFFIQSPDGDNRLVLGMVAQTDGRFSLVDPNPIINTFTIRKVRPTLTGRIARYFD